MKKEKENYNNNIFFLRDDGKTLYIFLNEVAHLPLLTV